jgi:hypothetical protein
MRALASAPAERYRSCSAFVEALASALGAVEIPRSGLAARSDLDELDDHFASVVRTMLEGRLVLFLGQGANLCGRPDGVGWDAGSRRFLPDDADLATYLAEQFDYPPTETRDLVRVAQYVAVMKGSGPLYDELHEVFDTEYAPSPLHMFVAELAAAMGDRGFGKPLIATTNWDEALERALVSADEEFDVVSYIAVGRNRGRFSHHPPDGPPKIVQIPNTYDAVSPKLRTVLLKIHGQVDRTPGRDWESFVVAEDDHLECLSNEDLSGIVPVTLALALRRSHFLFLGVGLREWSVRGLLHRIWGAQGVSYRSWAVQLRPDPLERELWRRRDVEVLAVPLDDYVDGLRAHLARARAGAAV